MSFGFNTEIRVGEHACHVQTEVRRHGNSHVETVVYVRGRVIHRRSEECADLAAASGASEEAIRRCVEAQHRAVIADLRAGAIAAEPGKKKPAAPAPGIEVHLLNPASWVAGGTATLEIEVLSRGDRRPLPSAHIEVTLEGAHGPIRYAGKSDERGRAQLSFPMPRLGPGGAELAIHAAAESEVDEVRYALRTKPRESRS